MTEKKPKLTLAQRKLRTCIKRLVRQLQKES